MPDKRVNYAEIGRWNPLLTLTEHDDGRQTASFDTLQTAALFAIRDELRRLNTLLHCGNFTAIPSKLDRIGRNTAKPKRKAKAKLRVVA